MSEMIVRLTTDRVKIKGCEYVQDLVRCGECERRKKNKFCLKHGRYEKNDDGFCSYAERKVR